MFSITLHYLDKKASQTDVELDPSHERFKSKKLAKCFTALREETYEAFKNAVVSDIQTGESDLIAPYLSAYSNPQQVYKTWGWEDSIDVGLVLYTQHIVNDRAVLKPVLFKTWGDFMKQREHYLGLEPHQAGFFSSGAIVLYKA